MRSLKLIGILTAVGLLAGCNSAMSRRISAHERTWRALTEQDQHRLLRGNVASGDTEEMVLIALGPPDKVMPLETQDGRKQTVWLYDILEYDRSSSLLDTNATTHLTSRERSIIFNDGVAIVQASIRAGTNVKLVEYRAQLTAENMTTRLDELVALSSEQKVKAAAIFAKANEGLFAISLDERGPKGRPIRVKMRADIRALLDPEQQAKYDVAPQYLGGGSMKKQ